MDLTQFSGKKRKLLEYMMDPENQHKSVVEICRTLGVSRNYFYQCMKDEDFNRMLNDVRNRCFSRYLAQVDKKISEKAAGGDIPSAKLFYEVQGMVGRGGNQTVNIANPMSSPPEINTDDYSDEEAMALIEDERRNLDEWGNAIKARKAAHEPIIKESKSVETNTRL
jgi:hypothetical protein